MDIMKYITDQSLILIPVIIVIGAFLKSNSRIPDWIIPWLLLIVSISLNIGIIGLSVQAIIQGILVVGAAVLGNQLFKQTLEGFMGTKIEPPKEINPTNITNDIK